MEHKDNMGNSTVIKTGDVQVMSAGTGVEHSEHNKNPDRPVKFLQIWILPDKRNVQPRYEQVSLNPADRHNKLQLIVSPEHSKGNVWINQNAWFNLGNFDKGVSAEYQIHSKENGVYIFILNGDVTLNEQQLNTRDGFGIWDIDKVSINADSNAEFLLMEVPMK